MQVEAAEAAPTAPAEVTLILLNQLDLEEDEEEVTPILTIQLDLREDEEEALGEEFAREAAQAVAFQSMRVRLPFIERMPLRRARLMAYVC